MADAMEGVERNGSAPLAEVATLFLKLGVIS